MSMMAELKREQRPEDSAGLLGAVFDGLPEPVALLDAGGRIHRVNPAWVAFARAHGADAGAQRAGVEYLTACRGAGGDWLRPVEQTWQAIRDVLTRPGAERQVLCQAGEGAPPDRMRLQARGFEHAGRRWAIVALGARDSPQPSIEGAREHQRLVEEMPAGMMIAKLDGQVLFANAALASMLDFESPQQMCSHNMVATWREPQALQKFIAVLKCRGRIAGYAMEALTHSGRTIRAVLSASLHGDEVCIVAMDITALRPAGQLLAESEKRFRATFEQAAVGIAHVASDGRFLRVNRKFCEIAGYSQEEMLARNFRELTHPDDLDHDLRYLQELLQGPESSCSAEKRYIGKDGAVIWTNLTVSLVRDAAGNPDYMVAVIEDISEQKRAERRHHDNQRRLRALSSELAVAAERERRSLARQLHDHLAQSLTFMGMRLASARQQCVGRQVATTLDQLSEALQQVIRDTRSVMSDISSPALNQGFTAALSQQVIDAFDGRDGLKVELIDDGAPKPLSAEASAILLRSVRELLMNAVKHAAASRVSVSITRKGGELEIVVEDDGKGLPDGRLPAGKAGQSGFGLFSIREQMTDLGGSFRISGEPGRGVRAILTVPLAAD